MSGTFSWPQVVNGKTYTAEDFSPFGYTVALPDLLGNFAAQVASSETATLLAQNAADVAALVSGNNASIAALVSQTSADTAALISQNSTSAAGTLAGAQTAASSAQSAAAAAQAAVASVTVGSTLSLAYPEVVKNLVAASDVVDVFVYDTRLDSDGGAWTERCSGTSWWNEALNTATRGAKRAFPKVAIIVARNAFLTIYDALDLDGSGNPRLWMEFIRSSTNAFIGDGGSTSTAIFAINGVLYLSTLGGLVWFDFPSDKALRNRTSALTVTRYNAGLSERNAGRGSSPVSGPLLLNNNCNHAHARVLPGAPLDPVSGLPIPTVAVATAGGVGVIHPDGRVVNITRANGFSKALFLSDNRIALAQGADGATNIGPIPYVSATHSAWLSTFYAINSNTVRLLSGANASLALGAIGALSGLTFLAEDEGNPANGMVSYATTTFATGWQPGDIRLAALCDGAVGALAESGELVTNGTFATDTTGWDAVSSVLSVSSGALRVTNNEAGFRGRARSAISTVVGATYLLSVNVVDAGGSPRVAAGPNIALISLNFFSESLGIGSHFFQFTATTATTYLFLYNNMDTLSAFSEFDNASVRLATPDRSYRAQGLNVVGSLTRAAVNTGNDLAEWSGFSDTNFLEQPYNPNLNFGTGDFFIFSWASVGSANKALLDISDVASVTGRLRVYVDGSGRLTLLSQQTDIARTFTVGTTDRRGAGRFFVAVGRRNGVSEVWVDGVREAATADTRNVSNTSAVCRVGNNVAAGEAWNGAISLLRIAAYAPTPAQIAKMYADERPLFDAGAKAFLGGTSNAVAGLSFSETTRRLAAATGDGVSIFSGLRRVEYLDAANTPLAIANDTMRAVSMEGGIAAFGTSANAGVRRDAITGLDRMPVGPVALHRVRRMRASGVTTDATPLSLAPRIHIGERETVVVDATITGRVYGATDSERLSYVRKATYYRQAGGNVTLQGSVQTIGTDTEVTAGADATLALDTTAQTVTPQVTGVAATRIVWSATLRVTRISEQTQYEETI